LNLSIQNACLKSNDINIYFPKSTQYFSKIGLYNICLQTVNKPFS
jgi:hypothetical protein